MNIAGKKLSSGDVAVGGGLIVGLIALFLPWYGFTYSTGGILGGEFASSGSVGGLNYWTGWFFFLAVLVGLALIVLRTFALDGRHPGIAHQDAATYMVVGGVMVVMALLWLLLGAPASYSSPGFRPA